MSCDVGEVTERLENELWADPAWVPRQEWRAVDGGWQGRHRRIRRLRLDVDTGRLNYNWLKRDCDSQLNLNGSFPSLHLRHKSFSNPSVVLPTSQLILQPFRRFTYVTTHSPTLPLLHLRHSLFSNPSLASPTSQALHLRHLASRPCSVKNIFSWQCCTEQFPL